MKISIIGGGPGGLYFALLAKKRWPRWEVAVYERNRADDTFGFGVVFSDATLGTFRDVDEPSYESIRRSFAYWDDVEVAYKGHSLRCGGNGFCGCSRVTLLKLLQERCRELGVEMHFQTEASVEDFRDSDLIVAADGINSRTREAYREHFQPSVDLRPNKFVWLGSTRPLDAFKYFFKETEHGILLAHCYQYEEGASTWIIETNADTWERSGFDKMDADRAKAVCEEVFAKTLEGHRLVSNKSIWRQFPKVWNEGWSIGNRVLVGDALHTAHFSIGSGTRLAMEDTIALAKALEQHSTDVPAALAAYEEARKLIVIRLVTAANASAAWYERFAEHMALAPMDFAMSYITRSGRVDLERLRRSSPVFVAAYEASRTG